MTLTFKNLLIGTVFYTAFGVHTAHSSSAPQTEWGVSSYIFPITKEIVTAIDSAKDSKEAWDKLCGKKLLKGGLFRDKRAMQLAQASPHFAMLVAYVCSPYPGFDKTDIAAPIKNKLWGAGSDKKLFKMLWEEKIKETEVKETKTDPDGTKHYKWQYGGEKRTVTSEIQYYGQLDGINNTKYPVCMVSNPDKLPPPMKTLQGLVKCGHGGHGGGEDVVKEIEQHNLTMTLGANIKEDDIHLQVTHGDGNQVIFDNERGARTFQKQLRNNNQVESVVIPFLLIAPEQTVADLLASRPQYLLLTGNLQQSEAQELENTYRASGVHIFSTQTPERDGVFAYLPAKDGYNPEFRMIAKPIGELRSSIAVKQPQVLENLAKAIAR